MYSNAQPKSLSTILYSKAAVARITGVNTKKIARVEIWWKVIFVVFKKGHGLRPRFISKKSFWQDFETFRAGNTDDLELHPNPYGELNPGESAKFAVINPKTDGVYVVTLKDGGEFHCTCQDYESQVIAQDKLSLETGVRWVPKCKHIHKVLGLGSVDFISSLQHGDGEPVADDWFRSPTDWLSDYDYSQVPANW